MHNYGSCIAIKGNVVYNNYLQEIQHHFIFLYLVTSRCTQLSWYHSKHWQHWIIGFPSLGSRHTQNMGNWVVITFCILSLLFPRLGNKMKFWSKKHTQVTCHSSHTHTQSYWDTLSNWADQQVKIGVTTTRHKGLCHLGRRAPEHKLQLATDIRAHNTATRNLQTEQSCDREHQIGRRENTNSYSHNSSYPRTCKRVQPPHSHLNHSTPSPMHQPDPSPSVTAHR